MVCENMMVLERRLLHPQKCFKESVFINIYGVNAITLLTICYYVQTQCDALCLLFVEEWSVIKVLLVNHNENILIFLTE